MFNLIDWYGFIHAIPFVQQLRVGAQTIGMKNPRPRNACIECRVAK